MARLTRQSALGPQLYGKIQVRGDVSVYNDAMRKLAAYEDTGLTPEEIEATCAALKLAQARAGDYEADIEAGNLVRLPGELVTPYELNERYWICGWDSEHCTLTIQDRVLKAEAARAALEGWQHGQN